MKETNNWRDVYKLPLKLSPFPTHKNFVLDSDGMFVFEVLVENEITEEVIRRVNGDLPRKLLDNSGYYFKYNQETARVQLRETDFLSLRDFRDVNSINGVQLNDLIKLQKDFGEFICNQLNQSVLIYTSYFANVKKLPNIFCPISISGKAPDGWKGLQYKKLAPKYETWANYKLNGGSEKDYITDYLRLTLMDLDCFSTVNNLLKLANDRIPCLICYEKPEKFCHRHLVADWINRTLIREVEVFEYEDLLKT